MAWDEAAWGWPSGSLAGFLIEQRWLRLGLAAAAGACLGVSGASMQALLRNPLAEPYLLGVSAGGAAGLSMQAVLATSGVAWAVGAGPSIAGVLVGCVAAGLLVTALGQRRGVLDPAGLILAGVVVSAMLGSLVTAVHQLAPGAVQRRMIAWMLGEIDEGLPAGYALGGLAVAAVSAGWMAWRGRKIDACSFSDDEARGLGVSLGRARAGLLLTACVGASAAVLIAGPVAFVGLIAPHLARSLVGPGHRSLGPASACVGAAMLIGADAGTSAVAAALPGVGRLPVGLVAALGGGPVFLWMLRRYLGRSAHGL